MSLGDTWLSFNKGAGDHGESSDSPRLPVSARCHADPGARLLTENHSMADTTSTATTEATDATSTTDTTTTPTPPSAPPGAIALGDHPPGGLGGHAFVFGPGHGPDHHLPPAGSTEDASAGTDGTGTAETPETGADTGSETAAAPPIETGDGHPIGHPMGVPFAHDALFA
jgi:hypothetical protein